MWGGGGSVILRSRALEGREESCTVGLGLHSAVWLHSAVHFLPVTSPVASLARREPNLQHSDCKMSSPTDFLSTISTPPSSAFAATTSPSSKPPSTDSQSCLAQLSSPAPIGTTLPPTKLPLMDPDPTPVQTEEKSFFVPKHRFGFSLPSDQGSRSKKRHFGVSLPSDQGSRPSKRVKKLLTTVSAVL